MRRLLAQWLAGVTGAVILLLAVLFASMQQRKPAEPLAGARPSAPDEGSVDQEAAAEAGLRRERGQQVFREQRCGLCHSIAGAGNRRSPLDDVGARLSQDMIRRWIVDPQGVDPTVNKPSYNIPEEDLEALVAYLATLRGESDP